MDILSSDELHFKIASDKDYWNPDLHIHNFYEIFLLLEGDVEVYINDSKNHIRPGTLILFNDHEVHKSKLITPGIYRRCFIHIPPALLHRHSTAITNLSECFYNREPGTCNIFLLETEQNNFILQNLKKMIEVQRTKPLGYDVLTESYLIQILVMVNCLFENQLFTSDLSDKYPALIKEIMSYLDEHLLDELTLEQIAQAFFMDKYYICHIFKKETGTTLFRFLLLKRISLSRILLAQGKNITEACFQSGFRNYNNFITIFRKCTGCTPKQYKDMLKTK